MNPTTTPPEDPLVEWNAPSHIHQERSRLWYASAAAFILASLGYSIATGGWTFTILIVVLTTMYWKIHTNEPPVRRMRIWRQGFAIDDTFTDWGNCTGYWIIGGNGYHELHIERRSGSDAKILTGAINPYLLHDLLPNLVPHLEGKRESILDTIIRICKL